MCTLVPAPSKLFELSFSVSALLITSENEDLMSWIVDRVMKFGTLKFSSVHNSATTNSVQIKIFHKILDVYKNGLTEY